VSATDTKLDPVTFEVLKNAFRTLVQEMSEHVLKTCHSFVMYNRDFAHTLHDRHGNMVSHGVTDLAGHLGTMHHTAKAMIEAFEGDIHPGDVFISNDSYIGNTHWNDVRVLRPVFFEGELFAFAQSSGHWADIGGNVPGSFDVMARSHYSEALRITPVRVWHRGEYIADVGRLIASNTRMHRDAEGDLFAQANATAVAERELIRVTERYGLHTVLTAFDELQDYAERYVRNKLTTLPDGSWERVDYLDMDHGAPADKLIPVRVKMAKRGSSLHFDFTGTHPILSSIMNAPFGGTYSAVAVGVKMFFPDIPLNSGFFRTITVDMPAGSIVDAQWPTACTGFVMAYEKIVNSVLSVWSEIDPARAMSCSFNLEYLLIGGFDHRQRPPAPFMWYDWLPGGWGGKNGADGGNYSTFFGVNLCNQPLEGQERLAPAIATEWQLVQDSAGPGRNRGGLGVVKGARITAASGTVASYMGDRERAVVWGDHGGLPASPQGMRLVRDGVEQRLGSGFANVPLQEGDVLWRPSSGGGGFGDPLERAPADVLEDVIDEYVSVSRARKDYGVVVRVIDAETLEYEIDETATVRERNSIRASRRAWLEQDAEELAARYRAGELDDLDLVRQHGVILKWESGELLPESTRVYRQLMRDRAAAYWAP
jgi:N-methylhydantoinase B